MTDAQGSAFPVPGTAATGMTIREAFAIECLKSLITANERFAPNKLELADDAIRYADALIESLNECEPTDE